MEKIKSKFYLFLSIMGCCGFLSFVGHEVWRIMKFIVAGLAFVGSIITFFNIVCNIFILREIVAAVLVVSALFMMIDSAGIEAVLNKFRREIDRLHNEVNRLEVVERELTQTSQSLQDTAQELRKQVANYTTLNKQYVEQNNQYAVQLQQSADILAQERLTSNQLQNELQELQNLNKTLESTTQAQKLQIQRLILVQQNAQKMIDSLMQAGDDFDRFGEIISKSAKEMEDTNTAMERLLKELTKDKFDDLDENHDGFVTEQELENFTKRKKNMKILRYLMQKKNI